ncbi:type IV pilin protein [Candidatus Macondimonas diazotrophica]|jgi:type IV pilus assembly protein PilE|nr:type IV pilin protein [Candidatus Macondimonas diazotrophica]NCU01302.1 prepilin-type N-terminal cleavage/methylation domain-containing protein [Candidatus Macondimonas diazotrophica]
MTGQSTTPTGVSRAGGFTLIELLIAVVVVTLLLAIAIPSYREQTRKGYRSLATTALMDRAARLERCAALDPVNGFLAANTACPTFPSSVVDEGGSALWTIAISNRAAITYTLQATPVGGSPAAGDTTCATIQITHTGARTATNSGGGNSTTQCW